MRWQTQSYFGWKMKTAHRFLMKARSSAYSARTGTSEAKKLQSHVECNRFSRLWTSVLLMPVFGGCKLGPCCRTYTAPQLTRPSNPGAFSAVGMLRNQHCAFP